MKIYTLYSQSHKILFDSYFKPTLPSDIELVAEVSEQLCESANYYENGWTEMCFIKVLLFRQACLQNLGSHFIWSDVDVQFFGSIKDAMLDELGSSDIACQHDFNNHCSGLFIVKASDRTLAMFDMMIKNYRIEDQTTLNDHIHMVDNKYLSNRFYNYGQSRGHIWNGHDQFEVDKNILVHHANWTVGVDSKIRMLDHVKQQIAGRIIKHL